METILLAENNNAVRELLNMALCDELEESIGCKIVTVANGLEAYKLIHQRKIDLLITDLIMPHVSGFELIRYMKAFHPRVPIIIISASIPSHLFNKEEFPHTHFLMKPFILDDLISLVKQVLRNSSVAYASY